MLDSVISGIKKIRPIFLPFLRFIIRYTPQESIKKFVWIRCVLPYFAFMNYNFLVKTQFGSYISGNTEDQIQRHIYYFGMWEPNLTKFINNKLKEGDIFVDVGANIGYFTLLASKLVGNSGKVIAIEASPKIYKMLIHNIQRNSLKNIETFNIAASNKEELLEVFQAPNTNIGQTTILPSENYIVECKIPAKPLSDIIKSQDLNKVNLIKIDVEGAELAVVQGLRKILLNSRNDLEIVVEVAPNRLKNLGKSIDDILNIFLGYGFFPYKLENNYSPLSYMSQADCMRPERITSPITSHTDVIFSKKDAKTL